MGFSVATATYLGIGDPDEDVMDLFSLDSITIIQLHCRLLVIYLDSIGSRTCRLTYYPWD